MEDIKSGTYRNGWKVGLWIAFLILGTVLQTQASTSIDYCINPPLLGSPLSPNLLLMLDNSASMYDLTYVDKGKYSGTCSITTTSTCSDTIECPAGETCTNVTFTRKPYYCYDQTFRNTDTYVGYFDSSTYYKYNFSNNYFEAILATSFPSGCVGTGCVYIADTLCIDGSNLTTTTGAKSISAFYVKGNYLNWLTASKFDVQKEILTGGKWDPTTQTLVAESRGCVGRGYIKEALTSDFVNYASPETNNTNTSAKVAFRVRGPADSTNASAPSSGGQSYLDIFAGADYRQELCQTAIDTITNPSSGHQDIRTSVNACLTSLLPGESSLETKQKVAFNQTTQECWQYRDDPSMSWTDAVNTVKTKCTDIYKAYDSAKCAGGTNDGTACTLDSQCTGGGLCQNGPRAVVGGNPAFICGSAYTGACYTGTSPGWGQQASDWSGSVSDGTTTYAGNACIEYMHKKYCGAYDQPEVIDPTDDPSVTTAYSNLPAILSDAGIEAQLDNPVKTLTVKLKITAEPKGLIQDFESQIRIGLMSFNFNGSESECGKTYCSTTGESCSSSATCGGGTCEVRIPCPKVCSTDKSKTCGSKLDCPSPSLSTTTCDTITASTTPSNSDGAKILHDVGKGKCSSSTSIICTTNENCPGAEKCISDGVGNHSAGLIKTLDDIRGTSWTPFAEGFYNAMGYFAPQHFCYNTSTGVVTTNSCDTDGDCSGNERCKFVGRTDLRIKSTDFEPKFNPSGFKCQKSNVLLVSDGMSTADRYDPMLKLAELYVPADSGVCPYFAGSKNLDDLAYIAKTRNLSSLSTGAVSALPVSPPRNEYLSTYVVYNGAGNGQAGDCNSESLLTDTAQNGGTTIRKAEKPEQLSSALRNSFLDIAAGTVSGTAASVLASGEGNGANLVQAVFYPNKKFGTTDISWIGKLTNFWYYVDPKFTNSNIREDNGDRILSLKTQSAADPPLKSDYISQFFFDANTEAAMARRWTDTNGDAEIDTELSKDILLESMGNLWEAGKLLSVRNPSDTVSNRRKIYTANLTSTPTTTNLMELTGANEPYLRQYLQAGNSTEGQTIIYYTRGYDSTDFSNVVQKNYTYRPRKVNVDLNGDGDTLDTVKIGGVNYLESTVRTWKLGDVLNSTPKISSWMPLNWYHTMYLDTTYGPAGRSAALEEAVNNNRYTETDQYKKRGIVFAGANDGMLHAFKLGRMELNWSGQDKTTTYQKARLVNIDTGAVCDEANDAVPCGYELWAYVPENVLPYLKHMAETNYFHNYTVDLTPFIFDASIGAPGAGDQSSVKKTAASWRTIVIGGMRLGGGSKDPTYSGTEGVKVPVAGKGYSSYFALDVTDQNNPVLLWEFNDPALGFATSGPAVVRINAENPLTHLPDKDMNGKWFVVFASGPTGPRDTVKNQFLGRSDQELKIFVLDLKSGNLLATLPTGINYAFAGSIYNATQDIDLDYQDDVLYIPYVKRCDQANSDICENGKWTDGGVLRLLTRENPVPSATNWEVAKLIDGTGPVTSAVVRLQNVGSSTFWVYFGTGRYFYENYENPDEKTHRRSLFGIKDECYATDGPYFLASCPTTQFCSTPLSATCGDLKNADSGAVVNTKGWYINLEPYGPYPYLEGKPPVPVTRQYRTERVITDPLAVSSGVVYFTTYKPYDGDPCRIGGKTFIWALKYDTGGDPSTLMKGKALVQVSTGSIEQIDINTAFTEQGGRRTSGMEGVPPTAQGLSVLQPPPPVKRVMHIKER